MNVKSLFASKRFWAGVITLLTGVSFILTGEKTFEQMLPEIVLTVFALGQMIIAVLSGKELEVGGVNLSR